MVQSCFFDDQRFRLLTTEDRISLKDATILWTKQLFEISMVRKTMFLEKLVDVVEQRASLVKRLKTHFNNYDLCPCDHILASGNDLLFKALHVQLEQHRVTQV